MFLQVIIYIKRSKSTEWPDWWRYTKGTTDIQSSFQSPGSGSWISGAEITKCIHVPISYTPLYLKSWADPSSSLKKFRPSRELQSSLFYQAQIENLSWRKKKKRPGTSKFEGNWLQNWLPSQFQTTQHSSLLLYLIKLWRSTLQPEVWVQFSDTYTNFELVE